MFRQKFTPFLIYNWNNIRKFALQKRCVRNMIFAFETISC